MGSCQRFLTQVGVGHPFVAQVGLGQLTLRNFPSTIPNFSIFSFWSKKSHGIGSKDTLLKDGSAPQ